MYAPIAQPVEQLPFKEKVVGSIPTGRTTENQKTSSLANEDVFWFSKQSALLAAVVRAAAMFFFSQKRKTARRGRQHLLELERSE